MFPIPVAAIGPDYAIGDSYYPLWHETELEPGYVEVITPNFGFIGSHTRWAGQGGRFGATAKVLPLEWDPGPRPGFDPRNAAWNNLPRGTLYHQYIANTKRNANFQASAAVQQVTKPVKFNPASVASLIGGTS